MQYQKTIYFFSLIFIFSTINIYFFTDDFINIFTLLHETLGYNYGIVYAVAVLFSLGALSLLFFIEKRSIFIILLIYICIAYIISFIYNDINGTSFSYQDLRIAMDEAGKLGFHAALTFQNSILYAFGIVFLILIPLAYIRKNIVKRKLYLKNKIIFPIAILSILGTFFIISKTAYGTNQFPAPIKLIDTFLYSAVNSIYYGPRNKLTIVPTHREEYKNIVWIIDESIGGKYLSQNGYIKETTPYLDTLSNNMINLGLASSGSNLSSSSNLILMSGIQLANLPDKETNALKKSNIFQYAQNAGYYTSYISGQSHEDKLQNFMTNYDTEFINHFYQPTNEEHNILNKVPEKYIIDHVKSVLDKNEKNFIFIVKAGAHFDYENDYPQNKKVFFPTLSKNQSMKGEKKKSVNSYLNAIRWTVNDFFKHFFEKTDILKRKDTLIIYTSDHGQSILENNIVATHGTVSNAPKSQGIVPLILFTDNKSKLEKKINTSINSASHFMIFPTTINLMGYDTNHTTLLQDNHTKQIFISGGLFGLSNMYLNDINK